MRARIATTEHGERMVRLAALVLATAVVAAGCASPRPRQAMRLMPTPVASAVPPGALTHRIAPRETLWSIGQRYGVPYRDIMRANGLTDASKLAAGRDLVIPRPSTPRLPAPTARIPLTPNPRWTHIVIHHSATERGNAKLLDRSHRRRGFTNGLGYHFVIDNGTSGRRDGGIEVGRRWLRQREGAHCNAGGMNQHGIGICLVGNFTRRPPSAAQMQSLAALVEQLETYYRIPRSRIIRHRDVRGKGTACPGDAFPWAALRARLAE